MKRKETIFLIVMAVLMVLAVVGVGYAAFSYFKQGSSLNVITSGIMQMSYEESSNVIKMTGALPTTDATGKVRLNEGEYFDFTVSSTITGDAMINWEIAAEDFVSNMFDGKNIKLYLTSLDSNGNETEVMAPKVFTKATSENKKTGRPANMMSLATGTMSASTSTKYRLRMWVDENYNPQGDGGNKTFAVRVNVYGKLYEEPMGSQMINLADPDASTAAADFFSFCQDSGDYVTVIEGMNGVTVPSEDLQSFDLSENQDGSVVAYVDTNSDGTYKLVLGGINGIVAPTSLSNFVSAFTNIKQFSLSCLDTSKVTDMSDMFLNCSSLTSVNLSNFDTSNVVNMSGMFEGCRSLTNLDLSSFNTTKVTNMNRMFAICSGMQSIKVGSKWVVNSGCITTEMFDSCGVSAVTVV